MQTLVTLFAESTTKHGVLEDPWLEANVYVQMEPQDEGVSGVREAIAGGWMSVVSAYVPVITSITGQAGQALEFKFGRCTSCVNLSSLLTTVVDTTYSKRTGVTCVPLELGLTITAPERRDKHAMRSVRVVRGSALLTI